MLRFRILLSMHWSTTNQSDYWIVTCYMYTLNTFTVIFSSHHSTSAQLNHKKVTDSSWWHTPTTKQCSSPLTHFSEGEEATRWRRLSSYLWWAPMSWRYMYVHYVYTTVKLRLSRTSFIQTLNTSETTFYYIYEYYYNLQDGRSLVA